MNITDGFFPRIFRFICENGTSQCGEFRNGYFSEFTNALSNPVVLGIINFAPMAGDIILELSTNIGFAILDRMLGGAGKPLEKNREFSEIELSILDKIMVTCMQLLREPWKM